MNSARALETDAGARYGLVLSISLLTLMQAALAQFLIHGIPLFLREAGHAAQTIGLVYIAAVPYVTRFLWAPLVDRYGSKHLGHYRTWILAGHILCCVTLGGLVLVDPATALYPLIAIIFVMMIAIATQLTATGGIMVTYLGPGERAAGASAQTAASGLAGLVLGFCVLYLLADLGWQTTVSVLLGAALFGLLGLTFLRLDAGRGPAEFPASFWSQFSVMTRRDTLGLFLVTALVGLGLALTYGLKSLVLIDAGYSVAEAGLVGLVLGNFTGIVCALAARSLVDRFGGFKCLAMFGLAAALYGCVFSGLYAEGLGKVGAAAFVAIANGLAFASFIASRSLLMARCAEGRKATEFATFISLEGLCVLIFAALGNMLSQHVGFSNVLLVAAAGSFAGAVWAYRMHVRNKEFINHVC